MSDRLERLKDELVAIVDGEPGYDGPKDDTDGDSEFRTLVAAAKNLPSDFDKPAWSFQSEPDRVPEMVGPFRIMGVLGRGGMGIVYRAEQAKPLAREIALKVIRPGLVSKSSLSRFELERSVLARLCHPNVAAVLETGACDDGNPYVAMELVDGQSITDYATANRLSLNDRLALLLAVCKGLAHAHARGVIHRDLKPSNLLVVLQDGRPVPKIIDFGIARVVDLNVESRLTLSDQLLGTLEYMSPEVIEHGAAVADARSDVYALGAILYELVVGIPAVSLRAPGVGILRTLKSVREQQVVARPADRIVDAPPEHSIRAQDIGADLNCVILHALEGDPNDRYQSPSELAADLERYVSHRPILATPPSAVKTLGKFLRRNRLTVSAAGVIVLSLVLGLGAAIQGYLRSERSRQIAVEAQQQSDQAVALLSEATVLANTSDPRVRMQLAKLGDRIETMLSADHIRSPFVELRLEIMLANAYAADKQFERADPLLRRAARTTAELAMWDEHFQTLKMLAENQTQLGLYSAAIKTAQKAISAANKNENAQQRDEARFVLANAYVSSGALDEAARIYVRLLERDGPESDLRFEITLAQAQVMYATVLIQRRKDETAEHFARLGYGTYRRHFGLTTVNSLMAGQNLGAILAAVGKNDEAVEVFRPVLDARRRLLGREHADTLMTTVMLGRSLIALGQEDAGEQYLDQALEIGTEAYRQQNPIGVLASKSLATLYRERGDFDRAIQSAKAAVRFAESRHGKGDWRVEIHRVRLASLFHQVGDAEQAFALSESARQTLISVVGEQHPYARAAATTAKAAREQLVAIE